jgi:transposase
LFYIKIFVIVNLSKIRFGNKNAIPLPLEAMVVFKVGTTLIKRWLSSYRASGSTGGGYTSGNRSVRKIDPPKLESYLEKHPDAFLKEIAQEFSCCIEAAWKKHGVT